MAFVMKALDNKQSPAKQITYSQFIQNVEAGNVKEVSFQGLDIIQGKFIDGFENGTYFELTGNTGDETFKILKSHNIIPNYKREEKQSFWSTVFINWFPMILLFVIFKCLK